MCGGKTKSSIFAMHMCDDTEKDLGDSINQSSILRIRPNITIEKALCIAVRMQQAGKKLQERFGTVGDTAATNLAQDAKVFAGKIEVQIKVVKKIYQKLLSLEFKSSKIKGFDDPK